LHDRPPKSQSIIDTSTNDKYTLHDWPAAAQINDQHQQKPKDRYDKYAENIFDTKLGSRQVSASIIVRRPKRDTITDVMENESIQLVG
jgi:hypothetical protein